MDDEEELVRQVVSENPPEDQGVRPEWDLHQGWHRVEDTHREGHAQTQLDAEQTQQTGKKNGSGKGAGYNTKDDDPLELIKEETPVAPINEPMIVGQGMDGANVGQNDVLGKAARAVPVQQHKLRGAKVWSGDSANEKAPPTIPKPQAIGLAALVFFAYVTVQRRRMSKTTKDML
mmetsp:Transcript_33746/g.99417  ORF Transcript_33746/g.99417 Transcript_33746/m.99417 type:complete len:175 (-) Transcript_33746:348-872(-)